MHFGQRGLRLWQARLVPFPGDLALALMQEAERPLGGKLESGYLWFQYNPP